jgi:hypothetical protein
MIRPAARRSLRTWHTAIMCMTWLRLRFPASESLCLTTSPLCKLQLAPRLRRKRSSEPWAREARNVADYYSHDLRCQDRPDTEDLGEHGAGSLHLNSDALVEFRYPLIKSAHVSHYLGGQPPADSSGWVLWSSAAHQLGGGIGRELLLDRIGEEVPQEEYVEAVLRARVRSETRSSRLSVSRA